MRGLPAVLVVRVIFDGSFMGMGERMLLASVVAAMVMVMAMLVLLDDDLWGGVRVMFGNGGGGNVNWGRDGGRRGRAAAGLGGGREVSSEGDATRRERAVTRA